MRIFIFTVLPGTYAFLIPTRTTCKLRKRLILSNKKKMVKKLNAVLEKMQLIKIRLQQPKRPEMLENETLKEQR